MLKEVQKKMPEVKEKIDQEVRMSLRSRLGFRRPAYMITMFCLSLAWWWVVVFALASVSALVQHSYQAAATLMIVVDAAMAGYLIAFTRRYLIEMSTQYTLELTDSEMRLKVARGRRTGRKLLARMSFSEVEFVEYFTPRDNASLVFHGVDDRTVEVPVWSICDDCSEVLNFLRAKGLRVEQT